MKRRASEVVDRLIYITHHAPDFPAEDQTSSDREFDHMLKEVGQLNTSARHVDSQRSFAMAVDKIRQARELYLSGDQIRGCHML